MARSRTAEEAIERARALQDRKIDAVRVLAESNQNVTAAREDAAKAELEYAYVFNAALSAGLTPNELRKIGSSNTEKRPRQRRQKSGREVRNQPTPAGVES